MISMKEAFKLLEKEYPGFKVIQCVDYNNGYYCTIMPEKSKVGKMMDNNYAVDKNTGEIKGFSIASIGYANLSKFFGSKILYKA